MRVLLLALLSCLAAHAAPSPSPSLNDSDKARQIVSQLTGEEVSKLEKSSAAPPAGSPIGTKLISLNSERVFPSPGSGEKAAKDVTFTYELEFADHTNHVVSVTLRHKEDGNLAVGLAAVPRENFQQRRLTNEFYRWCFFALSLAVPIFMIAVAVLCFRRRPRRTIFWILFILVGVFRIDLNWSTGALQLNPLQAVFLGFQIKKDLGAWIISFTIPAGAFLFLFREWLHGRGRRG